MISFEQRVTAEELFGMCDEMMAHLIAADTSSNKNSSGSQSFCFSLHKALVLCCHEGIRDTEQAFGNLFAQVDYLCKKHQISIPYRIAIQEMRRHSNHAESISMKQAIQDIHALALFISKVYGVGSPYPAPVNLSSDLSSRNEFHGRGIVEDFSDTEILLHTEDGNTQSIDYSATHLQYLQSILQKGMQLNVLNNLIIVEPDYLIDISRIAACFEQHGHHPLNYLVNTLKPSANTQAILLGNLAGNILDDTIKKVEGLSLGSSIIQNFREKALEYSTCGDFVPSTFKQEAQQQALNIQQAVNILFNEKDAKDKQAFCREKSILEPSFVCEQLGISGRVDLMTSDFKLLVEQKSGKNWNIQTGFPGEHGSYQLEPHYVQLLLYYGVLQQNFHLGFDRVNLRLLYSKYPAQKGLVVVNYLQSLFHEAIEMRNLIVATDLKIAREGFSSILSELTPETLNVKKSESTLFLKYKLPQLKAITAPLHTLKPLEKAYFERMLTFVYREQRVSKLGQQEGITSGMSDLWNMPLAEKEETGNIIHSLKIEKTDKKIVRCSTEMLQKDILPNFRRGDMVYLYTYPEGEEPDVRKSILYKGNLEEIRTDSIVVILNEPQYLDIQATYAIEHASSDSSTTAAIRGLYEFITASEDRKALLLGQREPCRDSSRTLSHSYHKDYDVVIRKAMQAEDYFLLMGPPGTGKTSMALQFLVKEELTREGSALLLMAYTNRAVDEICSMLEKNAIDYLRLGNEYSCEPRFKNHLLDYAFGDKPRLDDIKAHIKNIRVVVGTTSMLQARPFIFAIKNFSLAIIDEASQILEPNIIGLLSKNTVGRFILIGDHKQLPAVVQQSERDAQVEEQILWKIGITDCRRSLFERLIQWERKQGREDFIGILRKQGRMHPEIAEWPNRMFYSREQLIPVPLPHQLEESTEPRLVFIPSEACKEIGLSDKVNINEAHIVCEQLHHIYKRYGHLFNSQKTVGVIVPYRNQIAVIRKEIEQLEIPALLDISIDTVERYQGSQRDIIIYSFTVQNPYQLDFLTANCIIEDGHVIDRKLNVALTRARKRLILTGNETILRQNYLFSNLIDYIKKKQ